MNAELSSIIWLNYYSAKTVEDTTNYLYSIVHHLIDKYAPKYVVKFSKRHLGTQKIPIVKLKDKSIAHRIFKCTRLDLDYKYF